VLKIRISLSFILFQMAVYELMTIGLVVAIILFLISDRAQYSIKMMVFIVSAIMAATLPVPLMLFRPKDYRNAL